MKQPTLTWLPDSSSIVYVAAQKRRFFVVARGLEGKPYEAIDPMIAFDGADRMRYLAFEGGRLYLIEETFTETPA